MAEKTVVLGADHAGYALKEVIAAHLRARGVEVVDVGTNGTASTDYPDHARAACSALAQRAAEARGTAKGILVCGTGIGMSMTANRQPGIRAAVCATEYQCRMARLHNDANVLCLGERVTGQGLALAIVDVFLDTEFEGGRHARRVDKIESAC